MASVVGICNIALSNLGETKITSLEEGNAKARACNLRYEDVRDAVLRAHPWNCVQKRDSLAKLAEAPAWGFANAFQLPGDCLSVERMEDENVKYQIEGRELLTDESTAKIKYTRRVEDPNTFDALLIQSIGHRLAYEICETVTKDSDLKDRLWKSYIAILKEARSVDGQESAPDAIESDLWLNARF